MRLGCKELLVDLVSRSNRSRESKDRVVRGGRKRRREGRTDRQAGRQAGTVGVGGYVCDKQYLIFGGPSSI